MLGGTRQYGAKVIVVSVATKKGVWVRSARPTTTDIVMTGGLPEP